MLGATITRSLSFRDAISRRANAAESSARRPALHALVDDLAAADGVAWAGVTEAEPSPRWIAFAGPEAHAPLEPDQRPRLRAARRREPSRNGRAHAHAAT
jgi:hypothetical protein